MAVKKAANVTKVDAGGSGDNYVKDGYIKTVEKVWIDTFKNSAAIITEDTITIAKIPSGKKITGVEVVIPQPFVNTLATISIGLKDSDADATTEHTTFLAATVVAAQTVLRANVGIPKATTANIAGKTEAEVYLRLAEQNITTTNMTIATIVKYT